MASKYMIRAGVGVLFVAVSIPALAISLGIASLYLMFVYMYFMLMQMEHGWRWMGSELFVVIGMVPIVLCWLLVVVRKDREKMHRVARSAFILLAFVSGAYWFGWVPGWGLVLSILTSVH